MSKILVAVAAAALLSGCALPRYQTRLVSITDNPSAPSEQAAAICGPRAQMAYQRAASEAKQRIVQSQTQAPTYNCNTSGNVQGGGQYNSSTNCTQNPTYPVAVSDYDYRVKSAGNNARDVVLSGCLAEYGWRAEQYCVQNCK